MIHSTELCPWLPRALAEADRLMLDSIRDVPGVYREHMANILTQGGKRLRPALVLVCGHIGNPDHDELLRLAAGIELLHVATLVHDDIIDKAPTRRGVPSLNRIFNSKQAVIAGDYLMAKSLTLLHSALPETRTGEFLQGILHICRSELLQNSSRYVISSSIRQYLRRIAGKTAALFMLSSQTGAIQGGLDALMQQRIRRYAYNLGLAFQIIDDILDIEGTTGGLKKPAAQDLRLGIYTLPAVLAFRKHPEKMTSMKRMAGKRRTANKILHLINFSGSVEEAKTWAKRFTDRAKQELTGISDSDETRYLNRLLDNLLQRRH